MKSKREFSKFDVKYFTNDRVYVNVKKNGAYAIPLLLSFYVTTPQWESAKVLESNSHYVRAITDKGEIVTVPKTATKPVIKQGQLLFIENNSSTAATKKKISNREFLAMFVGFAVATLANYINIFNWY